MKLKFLILSILFLGLYSCNNDDDCTDNVVNQTSLENEYGCTNTKYQMDIDLSDDYTIIKSQSDFENKITGSCLPKIDFSKFDLIVGKKQLSNGNNSIYYELIADCKTGNKVLTVTFNQNETTEAPNLTYHALIHKLEDEEEFNVEIVIN